MRPLIQTYPVFAPAVIDSFLAGFHAMPQSGDFSYAALPFEQIPEDAVLRTITEAKTGSCIEYRRLSELSQSRWDPQFCAAALSALVHGEMVGKEAAVESVSWQEPMVLHQALTRHGSERGSIQVVSPNGEVKDVSPGSVIMTGAGSWRTKISLSHYLPFPVIVDFIGYKSISENSGETYYRQRVLIDLDGQRILPHSFYVSISGMTREGISTLLGLTGYITAPVMADRIAQFICESGSYVSGKLSPWLHEYFVAPEEDDDFIISDKLDRFFGVELEAQVLNELNDTSADPDVVWQPFDPSNPPDQVLQDDFHQIRLRSAASAVNVLGALNHNALRSLISVQGDVATPKSLVPASLLPASLVEIEINAYEDDYKIAIDLRRPADAPFVWPLPNLFAGPSM